MLEGPTGYIGGVREADATTVQALATQWAANDPDPRTAAQLRALLADPSTELADAFSGNLQFGTAGLRAAMGPGPNRMNRTVVRRAAAGLAAHLLALADDGGTTYQPRAVVGFDARHNSADFALDTAAIFTAAGIETFILPQALPTPILAYAVRALNCEAGVMVTASHNPAADNGYKVYLGGRAVSAEARGVQITAPHDALIAAQIAKVSSPDGDVSGIPLAEAGWGILDTDVVDEYCHAMGTLTDPGAYPGRELRIVHTALHGVGSTLAVRLLNEGGFTDVHSVPEQAGPDPDFPTVSFPNPEEAGALDLAFALAQQVGADVVLASDPDADRIALGAVHPGSGTWQTLHGDQVGALLGAHLAVRGGRAARQPGAAGGMAPVFANSIVSSRMLAKIAAEAGIAHTETLTGFKWISRVPGLAFGYEEALGYCVAPELVRDKDGMSAGLLLAELAAALKAQGRTVWDALDELALAHGLHETSQISLRVERLADLEAMMARIRSAPPTVLAGSPVTTFTDLAVGSDALPPTDGLLFLNENQARVIVRPSGTEPKLKCYLEAIVPVSDRESLPEARAEAHRQLTALGADITAALGVPG